jgi:hypothetical protein
MLRNTDMSGVREKEGDGDIEGEGRPDEPPEPSSDLST